MCKYCNYDPTNAIVPIYEMETDESEIYQACIFNEYINVENIYNNEVNIKIEHCPMCGEKLK